MEASPFDKVIKAFTTPYTEDCDPLMCSMDQQWEAAHTAMLEAEQHGYSADAEACVEDMQQIYKMLVRGAEPLLAGAN